jgi:hypothetical protein
MTTIDLHVTQVPATAKSLFINPLPARFGIKVSF